MGDSKDSYLDPSWGAGGLGCRTAEELLGSLSWAFCRRVCPTVSLLLAGRREASGGTLLQAHCLEQELLPPRSTLGRGALGKAGASQMAGLREKALLWHPYLSACAAGTAAPCHCPSGWQSGSPSGHRTSRPLSSSAHCRAGGGGDSQGQWGLSPAPTHPRCCHNPRRTQAQWAKSAGDWAETIHWAVDRLSYILSKHESKTNFVGQGRPKGRKRGMFETQAVQRAQGDAAVKSGGRRSRLDMRETQEQGMTHFSVTQTWEPLPGVTAERAALHWRGLARLGKAGHGASS